MEIGIFKTELTMIDKINTTQIRDIMDKSVPRQQDQAKAQPDNQIDASLQVKFASLVEKAMQIPAENTQALEQAKQLLLSGELESPENIKQAAQNIVEFGI